MCQAFLLSKYKLEKKIMKTLTKNKKLVLAIVLVIFIVALLIGSSILISNSESASKVNKTNLYINGELVEADEYGNVMHLHKYDGKEVKIEPKIVYHGKENGVEGEYLTNKYKVDQTIYPFKETYVSEKYPSEIGYYEIKFWFEFKNNDDWEPIENDTINIQLYIFDKEELISHIYSKYPHRDGIELTYGEIFKYKYDGNEHKPVSVSFLSNGIFGSDNMVVETILYKDGEKFDGMCIEKGIYSLILKLNDFTESTFNFKGTTETITWAIE
jgi:hypothetical protein